MNKLIYILAVILFAIPALAENVEEDIKISEMEIDGNRVILTDIYGKEVKNNIVHNEEDMINVPDYEKYLKGLSYGRYRANSTQAENYTNFLEVEDIPLFFAKIFIGNEIYNIEKMSVSDRFINVFELGYMYDEAKDTQLSCSDKFINGELFKSIGGLEYYKTISDTRTFPWKNKTMEKAKYVISKAIENKGEESSENNFFLALAEYLSDGLNNLSYIQEKMQKVLDSGATVDNMVSYLETYGLCKTNRNKCYGVASLLSKSVEFKEDNPAEAFNIIRDNGLINYAAFLNGYFNIFNDGFYELVQVSKVNEQSVLNILESSQLSYNVVSPYPRYFKTVYGNENTGDSKTYTPQHCTNNVYYGNVYIFPYNNVTYIINATETENKIVKIEVRSPKFFNTEYTKNYDIEVLLRNEINPLLHEVTTMNTFSYKDNIIYSKEYKKQPQSPLGDVDKLKERRGQKISPEDVKAVLGIDKFSKGDMQEEINKYMAYLQKYSSQQLIGKELYFYDLTINAKNPVILASTYFYNNNGIKTEGIFILNKNLEILDENAVLEIDNALNNTKFYKTVINKTNDSIFIGFINRDNSIFVVNIVGNKVGSGSFPIYYYESESEKINKMAEYKDFTTSLEEKAKIDCKNPENDAQPYICTDRLYLTSKAYIEELYSKKMERAEKNSYPESVKTKLQDIYNSLTAAYSESCGKDADYEECLNTILSYEDIFNY